MNPIVRAALIAVPFAAISLPATLPAAAQDRDAAPPPPIEADGTVNVPTFQLPPSIYLSDEARAALPRTPSDQEAPMRQVIAAGRTAEARAGMGRMVAPRLDQLRQMYGVNTREGEIAGVSAAWATPAAGVADANKGKIMLNLPGGGFVMGVATGTGMIESIPLAGLTGVEIVSITYRQGPEYRYPAATEDAVKVYRELLKTHKPEDIVIFGCSAGGALTAQTTAALVEQDLPLPSAIGVFCATGDARWGGDSSIYSRPFQALPEQMGRPVYYEGADLTAAQASPALAPDLLAKFPPTLIITATRAHEMSGAVYLHGQLVKAGAEADLHVWDGLGHAFFYDPALPESREAFDVMARFFSEHLHLAH